MHFAGDTIMNTAKAKKSNQAVKKVDKLALAKVVGGGGTRSGRGGGHK